jgi:two-component system alkaline phosphatase synthesis response regulator PhoP
MCGRNPGVARVLVIEDDRAIALGLRLNLRREGHEVVLAHDGEGGFAEAQKPDVDLVILDVMLPGRNGYELLKELRRRAVQTPVLMLTAKGMEGDKILGLKLGADDYLAKPFGMRETMARVSALLRRARRTAVPADLAVRSVYSGDVVIDVDRRLAIVRGEPLDLTKQEFDLLHLLAARPGIVFSREALLAKVWGGDTYVTGRTVDTVVSRLRRKIERDAQDPELILTAWGVGYKFADVE